VKKQHQLLSIIEMKYKIWHRFEFTSELITAPSESLIDETIVTQVSSVEYKIRKHYAKEIQLKITNR